MFGLLGCCVLGVDVSPVGVDQMNRVAELERLNVRGVVADIRTFEPQSSFAAVILDRVLHMLASDDERRAVLTVAVNATKPNGVLLVADGPKHRALIRNHIVALGWLLFKDTKNRTFARRPGN